MQAADIQVRKFVSSDQAEVAALYRAAFAPYQEDIPEIAACTGWFIEDKLREGGDMHDIQASFMDSEGGKKCFWVAVDRAANNKIVGCVGGYPSKEFDPTEYFELVRMAVDESYRSCGVARKVVSALEDFAREQQYKHVNLTTLDGMKPAMAFYSRNGYSIQRQVELDVEDFFKRKFDTGNKVNVVHFVKDL